jgi:putative inorganic carbon (hco3(-)) transporter
MESKIVSRGILLSFFIIIFLPPITTTLDSNTWRLFLFSIVNTFGFLYFNSSKDFRDLTSNAIKSKLSIVIGLFISWAALSSLYAINPTEVFVKMISFVNFYLLYINLSAIFKFNKFSYNNIALFMSFIFFVQLCVSYAFYFRILEFRPYTFEENVLLIGIFNNRNITSALYLLQMPFVIYLIVRSKSVLIKTISYVLSFAGAYMIFLLSSRTAYVIIFLLTIYYLLVFLLTNKNIKLIFKSYFGVFTGIFLAAFLWTIFSLGPGNSANAVNRIQTIDFEETSTNTRLRYYQYGIDHFFSNPFIGVGFGSWKIKSIDYDKENIISYVIPYTMHNDFLEVAVELGIVGLVLFLLIFVLPLLYLYKSYLIEKSVFKILVSSSLIIYIIDANLNFPGIRMSSLFYLALIISLIYNLKDKLSENN